MQQINILSHVTSMTLLLIGFTCADRGTLPWSVPPVLIDGTCPDKCHLCWSVTLVLIGTTCVERYHLCWSVCPVLIGTSCADRCHLCWSIPLVMIGATCSDRMPPMLIRAISQDWCYLSRSVLPVQINATSLLYRSTDCTTKCVSKAVASLARSMPGMKFKHFDMRGDSYNTGPHFEGEIYTPAVAIILRDGLADPFHTLLRDVQ